MSATVEDKIWLALKAQIAVMQDVHPLVWPVPGEPFTPPVVDGQPVTYIEVQHLPNANSRFLIGSDAPHDRFGIVQLAAMIPVALKWEYEAVRGLGARIAANFPTDHKMRFDGVTVRIEKAPDVNREYRDGAYIRVPVSVRYQSFC